MSRFNISGYLSENWAAVDCIFSWMYQTLPITIPDIKLDVSEPDKPLKHLTGNEMRKWLVFCGLERSRKIAELRINIKNHK